MNKKLDPKPFDNITDEDWRRWREMEQRWRAHKAGDKERLPSPEFSLARIYARRAAKFGRPFAAAKCQATGIVDIRGIYARRNRRSRQTY